MSEAAHPRMSLDDFLPWQETQELRFEFVDGQPVAMAGAKVRHDDIVVNVMTLLRTRLDRKRCKPFTADVAVITDRGNARRPDVGVDCGRSDPDGYVADAPSVVVEVLSPSTRHIDLVRKLDEYRALGSMRHVVLVDPDQPDIVIWSVSEWGEWLSRELRGMSELLALTAVEVSMTLAEIYDGITFPPQLSVVSQSAPPG